MLKRWNLIEARQRMGLKQKDIGWMLGIKEAAVCSIESGLNNPKPFYQDVLEEVFSIPRDTLFALIPQPKAQMKNKYEVRGDITAIFLKTKDGSVLETLIDTNDLEIVKNVSGCWYASLNKDKKTYYAKITTKNNKGIKSTISMHRLIMGPQSNNVIDHINHKTLDNRRSKNLREATASENAQNRKGPTKVSSSGIRGVRWYEKLQKWMVHAKINGKKTTVGYYETIEEAERVAKETRAKHMPYSQEALAN
jgi:DNA-binding XRE family transcriptional regulator